MDPAEGGRVGVRAKGGGLTEVEGGVLGSKAELEFG